MTRTDRYIDRFIRWVRDHPRTRVIPVGAGGPADPTYWRYFVIPRNPIFNIYLHRFLKDDEQHHHTHRMFNISTILQGEYFEERFVSKPLKGKPLPQTERTLVRTRSPLARFSQTAHRVVLHKDEDGRPIPIWSLFIGFPQIWDWGFWCPGNGKARWLSHKEYLKLQDGQPAEYGYSQPVIGCGD